MPEREQYGVPAVWVRITVWHARMIDEVYTNVILIGHNADVFVKVKLVEQMRRFNHSAGFGQDAYIITDDRTRRYIPFYEYAAAFVTGLPYLPPILGYQKHRYSIHWCLLLYLDICEKKVIM